MRALKIGIVLESTGLPLRQALIAAADAGAQGVEFDAVGDVSPDALSATGRRELRTRLRSLELDVAALNVPVRRGLDVAADLQPRIERIRKAMQLAYDLGARQVVVPCPKIPDDESQPRALLMREALEDLGRYGDRIGCVVALEIGYDPATRVKAYLERFDTGSLKTTFDPANFLLHGHDPLAHLAPLAGWIAHVHARDARAAGVSRGVQEVALGAGDVDWMAFTATLQVITFDGFLTVKREQGDNKLADVTNGVAFLRRFAAPVM
ncbi:MAG: sugar phosphate isomerase/epimerase family protein [Gemmataceae bacterium]|nr:sugar phosphate isomerase/epimerase [Gemmata sp.]MDW8197582.1 sugar phosphate isomerase/epimerase family protein [Gemmataceae bacterium]